MKPIMDHKLLTTKKKEQRTPLHMHYISIYDTLQSSADLADSLLPYQTVIRTREIVRFIEKHEKVLLKLDITAFSSTGCYIVQLANGEYLVTRGTHNPEAPRH